MRLRICVVWQVHRFRKGYNGKCTLTASKKEIYGSLMINKPSNIEIKLFQKVTTSVTILCN